MFGFLCTLRNHSIPELFNDLILPRNAPRSWTNSIWVSCKNKIRIHDIPFASVYQPYTVGFIGLSREVEYYRCFVEWLKCRAHSKACNPNWPRWGHQGRRGSCACPSVPHLLIAATSLVISTAASVNSLNASSFFSCFAFSILSVSNAFFNPSSILSSLALLFR